MKSSITSCIMLTLFLYLDQTKANLRIIFDRVEELVSSNKSNVKMLDLYVVPHNRSNIHAEFQILQDLPSNKLKLNFEVTKCLVGESPDTCEFLINLKVPNVCMFANAENSAWNPLTDAFTPKIRCTFKKGRYIGYNVTFDPSKWNIFPLETWYFKILYKLYEREVFSLGFLTETHFRRYQ